VTSSAESLHCPNCGGPAAPGDAACKYCHAELATVSCPKCFALMFDGAIYCPKCGAKRARAVGVTRSAPCPSCRTPMREVQVGQIEMIECGKCGGVWVDAATFEHVCADAETQAAVLHYWQEAPPRRVETAVRYRPCVSCGAMMNRINFGKLSGTVVDVCKGHGTFLDAGELHQVVAFIRDGGLERARRRQLEDLKEEEGRLRGLQQKAIHDAGKADISGWDVADGGDVLSLLKHLFDH
jgi:Zn-finger nucleic acid-binding protein